MNLFTGHYAANFESLIRLEGLDDLDSLMKTTSFEEVPLFSRYAHVSFLAHETVDNRSAILIRAAVSYLRVILAHSKEYYRGRMYDYCCMVSVTDWEQLDDAREPVTPNFWYTNPSVGVLDRIDLVSADNEQARFVLSALVDAKRFKICMNRSAAQAGGVAPRIYIVLEEDAR
jgi:hypothetical protein